MTGMLLSKGFVATYGRLLDETVRRAGLAPDIVHLPDDPQARLAPAEPGGFGVWWGGMRWMACTQLAGSVGRAS